MKRLQFLSAQKIMT